MAFPHNCHGISCSATLFWLFPIQNVMDPELQIENKLQWTIIEYYLDFHLPALPRAFIHSFTTPPCLHEVFILIVVEIYWRLTLYQTPCSTFVYYPIYISPYNLRKHRYYYYAHFAEEEAEVKMLFKWAKISFSVLPTITF